MSLVNSQRCRVHAYKRLTGVITRGQAVNLTGLRAPTRSLLSCSAGVARWGGGRERGCRDVARVEYGRIEGNGTCQ